MQVAGRTVVITGASSGIGRCLAAEVAARGGTAALVSRREPALRELAEELSRRYPEAPPAVVASADVSDRASVIDALRRVRRARGDIDVLINNAGISIYGPAERTEPEHLRTLLDVNLFGPLHATLAVLPEMRRHDDGVIVNVASVAALRGVPFLGAYGASKAAVAAFGQSLRAELAGTGIRVLNVYPGYTRTPLFEHERRLGGARRPSGPYAEPEEVARAVIRALEGRRTELVLSREGRAMWALARVAPRLLDRALAAVARTLRTGESVPPEPKEGVAS